MNSLLLGLTIGFFIAGGTLTIHKKIYKERYRESRANRALIVVGLLLLLLTLYI